MVSWTVTVSWTTEVFLSGNQVWRNVSSAQSFNFLHFLGLCTIFTNARVFFNCTFSDCTRSVELYMCFLGLHLYSWNVHLFLNSIFYGPWCMIQRFNVNERGPGTRGGAEQEGCGTYLNNSLFFLCLRVIHQREEPERGKTWGIWDIQKKRI